MSYIIMAGMFESMAIANLDVGVIDPRKSAEAVSACFLHCVLKGLGKSPRIVTDRDMFGLRWIPGVLPIDRDKLW